MTQTRRHVLKTGTLLAGSALTARLARAAETSSDDTLRIALVGCGGRGTGDVRADR